MSLASMCLAPPHDDMSEIAWSRKKKVDRSSLTNDGNSVRWRLASLELEATLEEVCKALHLRSRPSDEARW